jgi:hypothetical protein
MCFKGLLGEMQAFLTGTLCLKLKLVLVRPKKMLLQGKVQHREYPFSCFCQTSSFAMKYFATEIAYLISPDPDVLKTLRYSMGTFKD